MVSRVSIFSRIALCAGSLGVVAVGSSNGAPEFETDILPVFRKHCFDCHGPEKQKSSFRLDLKEAALRGGNDGLAIVPGKSAESPLIAHVSAGPDDDMRMPPKGERLSAKEIAALREWIAAGAVWPENLAGKDERLSHWAWQPLTAVEVPEGVNPVDYFLTEKLSEKGLSYSPEAGQRTLIRRLSFDLLGLPPSPEEVEAYVNDSSQDAYEKLVDRLLKSPHYGERFARHWLDIAHYADTHGFERDQRRDSAWRYRDYVIDSFNEDKPYDLFLREQIAGDVLWPDKSDAVVATGFLSAGPWDFVGQVETKSPVLKRAARALDLDDMATQVMTATMAMTVNCARCHDHKLDPISQKEYYQLWSVFAGIKREERVLSKSALAEYETKKKALFEKRDKIEFAIGKIEGKGIDLADIVGGGNGLGTGKYRQGIDVRSGGVQNREFGKLGNIRTNQFAKSKFPYIDGVVVPDGQDGTAKIPVSSTELTVSGLPSTSGEAWDMIRNGPVASQYSNELGGIDFTKGGHSLMGLHANAGITFDLDAIRKAAGEDRFRFTSQIGYFGKEGNLFADVFILVDGEIVREFRGLKRADGPQPVDIVLEPEARFLTFLSLDGGKGIGHDQVGFGDPRLKPHPPRELSSDDSQKLAELRKQREAVLKEIDEHGAPPKVFAVVAQEEVPEIRVLNRGEPESPKGEPVEPGAFSLLSMLDPDLGDLDASEGERRVALAEWITDPRNPLTRRVIANRLWYWIFGQGIVSTPSDFGLGGDHPSHPELLDWLAGELDRKNGSLKGMVRLLVTSRAYRQQSRYEEGNPAIAVDAGNRLLWHQNARRLEAEAVRDSVLAVSGKLNERRGGPGFEDFKYTEAYAPIYQYVTADIPALWRRSIYRYVVRTTPDRFMTTLDCPDPANLAPKRFTTTTPLQSLALYNNEFMLKQAGYLAERIENEVGDSQTHQVELAFQICFARQPANEERDLGIGFVQTDGLFSFCRSLLNANEFVYVD